MTSHLNIDWTGTDEINRREFNTNARWNEHFDKQGPLTTKVYRHLAKNGGMGGRLEGDAAVDPARALRKELHRRPVGFAEQQRAREGDEGVATLDDGPALPYVGGSPSSPPRRRHCHRKHRRDCPKHLSNELRRRNEAIAAGIAPPYSEAIDGPMAKPTTGDPVEDLVQRTHYVVGGSIAHTLTGSYDPKASKCAHRMADEHPNFPEVDAKIDRAFEKYREQPGDSRWALRTLNGTAAATKGASSSPHREAPPPSGTLNGTRNDGAHRHLTHTKVVPEKLVRSEHDTSHYRKKYDLKTHHEQMQLMKRDLLRK